jgi:hypothetical protein
MPITPWNWLWSATTVAFLVRARLRPRGRAVLQPFAASSAVAAGVAWYGIQGPWHLLLFPVFPLLYVAAAQMRLPAPRAEAQVTGSITVAYAPDKDAKLRREPRRRKPAAKSSNPMTWSTVAWIPTAVAAIVLLAFGVDEFWVIAPVFPLSPILAAGLWRRLDRLKVFAGADVRVLATLIALEVGVAVAAISAPESVPAVFDTAATSGRPTSSGAPEVTPTTLPPVLVEGNGMLAIVVTGSVAQEDGSTIVIPVEGAFVTLTPTVGAGRFALSDVSGRAAFEVDPGLYTVFVVPPGNRWSVMRGCRDLLERYPVSAGEVWTWQVPLVDDNAAVAYGSVTRCNDLSVPVLSRAESPGSALGR